MPSRTTTCTVPTHRNRLAARASLAQAILQVMDENGVDAIVYPDRATNIAPIVGGNQIGSNAGLSTQSDFPRSRFRRASPEGLPVGIELLGRPFAGTDVDLGWRTAMNRQRGIGGRRRITAALDESAGHQAAGESSSDAERNRALRSGSNVGPICSEVWRRIQTHRTTEL